MPRSALYSHRRTCHPSTATASHDAAARTRAQGGDCTIISQITRPKAANPKLPSAAPAASSAAASLPRRAPGRPAFSLRSRTCFSIKVALAGKIAGKALRDAHRWLDELLSDPRLTLESLASREGRTARSIRMTLSLAFLAPEIVKAAVEGRLPRGFGLKRLVDLPMAWPAQWRTLGLQAPALG